MSNNRRKRRKNSAGRKQGAAQAGQNIKKPQEHYAEQPASGLSCAECEVLLSDYMLELTSDADTKKVKQHLAICPQCQSALQEMELITSVLSQAEQVSPPPDFMKNLHRRLAKEQPVYIFVWNETKHICRKVWYAVCHNSSHALNALRHWFNSAVLPVVKRLAERADGMPKAWRIGAPVLTCVLVAAIISTGIFAHMRSTVPNGAGTEQLAAISGSEKQKENQTSDKVTDFGADAEAVTEPQPDGEAPQSPQEAENGVQTDGATEPQTGDGTAPAETASADTAPQDRASASESPAQGHNDKASAQITSTPVEGGFDEAAEDSGGAEAYSAPASAPLLASAYDFDSVDAVPEAAPRSSAGGSGGTAAKTAGTMDVYTIKTSDLSLTLSNSGFSGRAISEGGKTVLILTRSEYNRLQTNLLSAARTGNEEIQYTGSASVRNSYEYDNCFRVEITQR